MSAVKIRHHISKALLAIAYTSVVLEWLWISIIAIPPLIEVGIFDSLFGQSIQPAEPAVHSIPLSPLVITIVGIITVIILIITFVIIVRIPRTIVRTGDNLVNQTTEKVIPVMTHHKVIPANKRRVMSRRFRLALQLGLCLLPLTTLLLLPETVGLSRSIIAVTTAFLALLGAICFVLSWLTQPTKPTSRTRSHASRG